MYMELEDIINSLKREMGKEKGLKNKVLYEQAIIALSEIKERKN